MIPYVPRGAQGEQTPAVIIGRSALLGVLGSTSWHDFDGTVLIAKHDRHRRRISECPETAVSLELLEGQFISPVEDSSARQHVLFRPPGAATCLLIADAYPDQRLLSVETSSGPPSAEQAAFLTNGQHFGTVVLESPGMFCRYSIDETTAIACGDEIIIPATDTLPERRLVHDQTRFRISVVGSLEGDVCPERPVTADSLGFTLEGRPVRACVYRRVGQAEYELANIPESLATRLRLCATTGSPPAEQCTDFHVSPTSVVADPPSELRGLVPLAVELADSGMRVAERNVHFGAAIPPLPATAQQVDYLSDEEFEERAVADLGLLCLPAAADESQELPGSYLSVRVNGSPVSVDEWVYRTQPTNGGRYCPTTTNPEVLALMRQQWDARRAVNIIHLQNGVVLSDHVFRGADDMPVRDIGFYSNVGDDAVELVSTYAITRPPLASVELVCVTPDVESNDTVPVDVEQLTLRNAETGEEVVTFSAAEDQRFVPFRRRENGNRVVYCAEVSTSFEREGAVRAHVDTDDDDALDDGMRFAYRGSAYGCAGDDAGQGGMQCGEFDAQIGHLEFFGRAIALASVQLGGWIGLTGNEGTRFRIAALIPVVDAGVAIPDVITFAAQAGVTVPFTLPGSEAAQAQESVSAEGGETTMQPADSLFGIGAGAFAAACARLETASAPQVCAGVAAEAGLERVDKGDAEQDISTYVHATAFLSLGVGL